MNHNKPVIHIGNPKAYSTYLQSIATELEANSKIVYSGFRPNQDHTLWYNNDIESKIYNLGLRYQSKFHFKRNFNLYQEFILNKLEEANNSQRLMLFSSENIVMKGLPNELDVEDKLERLNSLLPEKKKVVCVFRNIKESIFSMYKEYVNHGYTECFSYFLDELYLFRESNFLDAFFPHVVHQQLKDNMSGEFIFIYTDNRPTKELFEVLFTSVITQTNYQAVNPGFSMLQAEHIAKENSKEPIETSMAGMSELHRLFWSELNSEVNEDEYLWQKRRKIKTNIQAGIHNANSTQNNNVSRTADVLFKKSKLFCYLQNMQAESQHYFSKELTYNLKQAKDHSSIWRGITQDI